MCLNIKHNIYNLVYTRYDDTHEIFVSLIAIYNLIWLGFK